MVGKRDGSLAERNARKKTIFLRSLQHLLRELLVFLFFQAEDGIRDPLVTGVQTCALPISSTTPPRTTARSRVATPSSSNGVLAIPCFSWGRSSMRISGENTCLPRLSTRNEVLRYRLPPSTAETKWPFSCIAAAASSSTGAWQVAILRPPGRAPG